MYVCTYYGRVEVFFLSMPHELPVQQFSRDDPGVSKNLHIEGDKDSTYLNVKQS